MGASGHLEEAEGAEEAEEAGEAEGAGEAGVVMSGTGCKRGKLHDILFR